jgi:hypothetical protein
VQHNNPKEITMAAISVGDYIGGNHREITPSEITARIDELQKAPLGLADEAYELSDDEEDELAALIDFRDDVERHTGNHFDEATIVPEGEFQDHARDWAHGIGDIDWLDSYVNWAEFASDLKGDRYVELDFGDDTVLVR